MNLLGLLYFDTLSIVIKASSKYYNHFSPVVGRHWRRLDSTFR